MIETLNRPRKGAGPKRTRDGATRPSGKEGRGATSFGKSSWSQLERKFPRFLLKTKCTQMGENVETARSQQGRRGRASFAKRETRHFLERKEALPCWDPSKTSSPTGSALFQNGSNRTGRSTGERNDRDRGPISGQTVRLSASRVLKPS